MSALGARPNAPAEYHRTKFAAEQVVRHCDLDWTIFRPSLIHGPGGDFMKTEARWARGTAPPFFAMPYFGAGWLGRGGAGLLQPVFVDDVARAFADALDQPATIGKLFEVGGSERLTWPRLHEISAAAIIGRPRRVLPFPVPRRSAAGATRCFAALLGFNRDQVEMSQEPNTCNLAPFVAQFGWEPASFTDSLGTYARSL